MTDIPMPRLSDSMEEGTIIKWLVDDGASVARGDELAEVETDKATMTYEADDAGQLAIVAREGDTVAVGELIAQLLAPGEAPAGGGDSGGSSGSASAPDPAAEAQPSSEVAGEAGDPPQGAEDAAVAAVAEPTEAPAAAPSTNGASAGGRVKASPLAKRIAKDKGIDLATLTGSGPNGRIVRADVESATAGAPAAPVAAPSAPAPAAAAPSAPAPTAGGAKGEITVQELSRIQKTIARRMAEAKSTIPHFQVSTDVDVTDLLALRAQMRTDARKPPSVNDFVVKASGLALREHPRANGAYKDGAFELHERVNVGVAVAGEDALIVPTVFDADTKPVTQIAADVRGVAARVRDGSVTPPELAGGTFSVSNLGMYGVTAFTAVVNPGQAAILAVGAAVEQPVVRDGEVVVRSMMTITLSADHRILYGADAAAFVATVRERLEDPFSLLS